MEGTVVFCDRQTRGRGRLGRQWISLPAPQLYLSLLLKPSVSASALPILSLLAGVSLIRTLKQLELTGANLKWPNDVLVRKRKVAGILAELIHIPRETRSSVLLGIGINVAGENSDFPSELRNHATTLSAEGLAVDRLKLLAGLLTELEVDYDDFQTQGTAKVQREFNEQFAYSGVLLRLDLGDRSVKGHATGINESGALLFRNEAGTLLTVTSGIIKPIF